MAENDGSIVLSTKIDTSGVVRGISEIKNKLTAMQASRAALNSLNEAIAAQEGLITKLNRRYADLVAAGEGESDQAKELKTKISQLTTELGEMKAAAATLGETGAAGFKAFAQGFSTAFETVSSVLNSVVAKLGTILALSKLVQFSKDASKVAITAESSAKRLVSIYDTASSIVGDFIDENSRALSMSRSAAAQYAATYGNLFSSWADSATNAQLTNKYLQMTATVASNTGRTVEDVQDRIRSGLLGNTESIEDLGIFVNVSAIEMTKAFKKMANGKSWEQLGEYTKQQIRAMAILEQATDKYGDEVLSTTANIQAQFNAAYEDFKNSWGQVVNTVLIPVLQYLTQILDIATRGLNNLFGLSSGVLGSVEGTDESTESTASNIEDEVDAQKELNAELKKGLATFDDINILTAKTADSLESSTSGGLLDDIATTGGGTASTEGSAIQKTDEEIQQLIKTVSGALMAIGCILLATGNLLTGLGLIIAGTAMEGIAEASNDEGKSLDEIANKISTLIAIVGVVSIIIGIILCYAGNLGTGIKMIALGAVEVFGTAALNWGAITDFLTKEENAWGAAITGALLVVLGILLCIAGAWGVGIGAIVIGAAALVTVVVLNWNSIKNAVVGAFNAVVDWIKTYGMLVLGILMCFTGAGLPFGLALIIKWAKENVEKIELASKIYDVAKKIGNVLIGVAETVVNSFITLFEDAFNFITAGIRFIANGLLNIAGAVGDLFGANWSFGEIGEVKLGRVSIPRLAQGAVIPANREFLAVLGDQKSGTNIETPLDTMVEAFQKALDSRQSTVKEERYYLNNTELMSIIYKLAKQGERQQGTNLVEGWT